jgi:glycosyltransferase involved in cell wall biosynthesis
VRIVVATTQVPFVRGGAERLASGLCDALRGAGHDVELVAIPFAWSPPERLLDHMLACRLLDLSEGPAGPVDRLIALKFPAYLLPHPRKVVWLLHQHRQAYDLWESDLGDLSASPAGAQVRDVIRIADRELIPQAHAVWAISARVASRLETYCGVRAGILHPPVPDAEAFYGAAAMDYLFFPSRLGPDKRQLLVLEALARTRTPVRVRFAGASVAPAYGVALREKAHQLGVDARVEWLEEVGDGERRDLYAHALGVVFPPHGEDYGYVTVEAMLAGKPVITCHDSGGPLEFVRDGETGLVSAPTPEGLAAAMDAVFADRERAAAWGAAGRAHHDRQGLSWARVVEALLS